MKKRLLLSAGILLSLIGIVCCLYLVINSTNFNYAYKEYKQAQIAATWFIDGFEFASAKDNMKNVEIDVLKNNLRGMETARDKMEKSAVTEKQKRIYHSVTVGCENIYFLVYAKENLNLLTVDDVQRLFVILGDEGSCRQQFLDEQ